MPIVCQRIKAKLIYWLGMMRVLVMMRFVQFVQFCNLFLAEVDQIPIIMGGDFNIHSHLDWTEATKDLYLHGGAVVNWTVSKTMESAGFKDSFREINPDPVKNIGTTWMTDADSLATPNRQDRIDYIYYQGKSLQAVSSQCYDNLLGSLFLFEGKNSSTDQIMDLF